MDADDFRLKFILEGQAHCDHFLTPLADPTGKTVLVVGAGAGTEMLWCLRRGAREVVGIDILEQTPTALLQAAKQAGLEIRSRLSMLRVPIEEAAALDREFDLVLSNNVFEHLPDLTRAFDACAALVRPHTGRVAIFTDPLFYSSCGSHLPLEPWEHLWGDPVEITARMTRELPSEHRLHSMSLQEYLFDEITLNRMRIDDLLVGIRHSGLAIINLKVYRDRNLDRLHEYRNRLHNHAITDLAIEGVAIELARVGTLPVSKSSYHSTAELIGGSDQGKTIADLESKLQEAHAVLARTENSLSFRLGRALTQPGRWIRDRLNVK